MPVQQELMGKHVPIKIYTNDIDSEAIAQLYNVASLPVLFGHIAVMPDVHLGKGATVGSVISTQRAIIPAAVGVDIGCGMNAIRLSLKASDLPDNLRGLRTAIEAVVPVGFNQHKKEVAKNSTIRALSVGLEPILEKHKKLNTKKNKPFITWVKQLGSLGGGNHFIELCIDENQDVWVMLHSGSRGIGSTIGSYFIELAKREMERHMPRLPNTDLAYFSQGNQYFDDYIEAVGWAQDYALWNRKEMMRLILDVLKRRLPAFKITSEAINCHHNYVAEEVHFGEKVFITRKGAIRAGLDELGIIPGSMGAKSYIVRGKGVEDSYCSCAHGAGRKMSRNKARQTFSEIDVEMQTQGIECRKDKGIIDEIPQAYKDIDRVMNDQADLIDVVHTLRQVMCIKG